MNNLIIAVIAIGLMAAVAGSGAWFGGKAYFKSTTSVYASQTIHAMNQIKAAAGAWQNDNPGASFPTTDPVTGTTYTSSNPVAWGDTLINPQRPYSELLFSSAYSSFVLNYGNHGGLTDWSIAPGASSGTVHLGSAHLYIVPDSTGANWVVWYLDMGSASGSGANGMSDLLFYGSICSEINQQMGNIPYNTTTLTMNNNNYNSGTVLIGLPYSPTGTYIANVCTVAPNSGSAQYFTFAMLIQ